MGTYYIYPMIPIELTAIVPKKKELTPIEIRRKKN
jgi:hypothetical protein